MAEFPAMPLWIDRYIADTQHLDRAQSGSYLHLLMAAWRRPHCSLPDDDKLLARWALCTPAEWAEDKPHVMAFWTLDKRSKVWTQNKLSKVRREVARNVSQKRCAALSRWNKTTKDDAAASEPHMRQTPSRICNQNQNQSIKGLSNDKPKNKPSCEISLAFKAYGEMAKKAGLPIAQRMTQQRKAAIGSRLKECGGLEGWQAFLDKVAGSEFLTGENDRGWKADLDFISRQSQFTKIMEGGHDNRERNSNGQAPKNCTRELRSKLAAQHERMFGEGPQRTDVSGGGGDSDRPA